MLAHHLAEHEERAAHVEAAQQLEDALGAVAYHAHAVVATVAVRDQLRVVPVLDVERKRGEMRRHDAATSLTTRAGTPATSVPGGTSRVTTAPAPTTARSPTVTPGSTRQPAPR